jgi:type II secretory pathway predicted ATPase ExeA
MSNNMLLAPYGLKYNPFHPGIPEEDLWTPPRADSFLFRLESIVRSGGFAMITGDPGQGKSKMLQLVSAKLQQKGDVIVGIMERPQSSLGDFYRELGEVFGVNLSISNRYGGFKALRKKWQVHIASTLYKPVLLIDEAQEMPTQCLSEIRLLGSVHFDSDCLLTTVLCGDKRLPERLRDIALLPIGTRIKSRLILETMTPSDLSDMLEHLLQAAGAPHLMTDDLKNTIVEHCAGNPRILMNQAAELLDHAIEKDYAQLDEKLFFETFSITNKNRKKTRKPR